jgi:hypothetical protein
MKTKKKPNTRTNRRRAQITAVETLLGASVPTCLISAVFAEPFTSADFVNAVVKNRLLEVLAQLAANVSKMPEDGSNKIVAAVMEQYPRA